MDIGYYPIPSNYITGVGWIVASIDYELGGSGRNLQVDVKACIDQDQIQI
jgi:hypothetical protein